MALPFFLVLAIMPYYGHFKVGYDLGAPRALFEKLPDYA